jgi:hypothetical protein
MDSSRKVKHRAPLFEAWVIGSARGCVDQVGPTVMVAARSLLEKVMGCATTAP